MTTNLKPYPAYKDSGVPWLGKVPEHWEVRRVKTLFQSRKQLNTDGSETKVLSLTLRGVVNNDPDNPEGLVPKDYKTYQIFERDDLVFKLIDLENVRTSRVGLVRERGIMSPAYVRLMLSGLGEVRFYYQQFYDLYQRCIYNQIGEGVRSTLGWSDLAKLRILAPPLPEQTAIVEYLDAKSAKIDTAIASARREIDLLREYRTRLIADVVTGKVDVREVAARLPEELATEEAEADIEPLMDEDYNESSDENDESAETE
jgi:type I restriction enzyme S subunit